MSRAPADAWADWAEPAAPNELVNSPMAINTAVDAITRRRRFHAKCICGPPGMGLQARDSPPQLRRGEPRPRSARPRLGWCWSINESFCQHHPGGLLLMLRPIGLALRCATPPQLRRGASANP